MDAEPDLRDEWLGDDLLPDALRQHLQQQERRLQQQEQQLQQLLQQQQQRQQQPREQQQQEHQPHQQLGPEERQQQGPQQQQRQVPERAEFEEEDGAGIGPIVEQAYLALQRSLDQQGGQQRHQQEQRQLFQLILQRRPRTGDQFMELLHSFFDAQYEVKRKRGKNSGQSRRSWWSRNNYRGGGRGRGGDRGGRGGRGGAQGADDGGKHVHLHLNA